LVLPVGGIKEKVLAGMRAGIKTIILPKKNEKDLEEIPEHIRNQMNFKYIQRMDEAIELALKHTEPRSAEREIASPPVS
jgi:ATP-dependent Lon protease